MNEIVYLNGSLMPIDQANISVLDYGFLYGFGLFETMRAYEGKIFLLERHLQRLVSSAKELGLVLEIQNLKDAVITILKANNLSNARIRLTISPGKGTMIPDPGACISPTVLIWATPFQPYSEQQYHDGFKAIISAIRRNSQSPLSHLKSANYLENILAKQEANKAGVNEALFLNDRGFLAEASMSNIFLVSNNILWTPSENSGILPGITRGFILELAAQLGINIVTSNIEIDDLFQAQEAFVTNSLIEIMPLISVEKRQIGAGTPGPISIKLMHAYRETVRESQQ